MTINTRALTNNINKAILHFEDTQTAISLKSFLNMIPVDEEPKMLVETVVEDLEKMDFDDNTKSLLMTIISITN